TKSCTDLLQGAKKDGRSAALVPTRSAAVIRRRLSPHSNGRRWKPFRRELRSCQPNSKAFREGLPWKYPGRRRSQVPQLPKPAASPSTFPKLRGTHCSARTKRCPFRVRRCELF